PELPPNACALIASNKIHTTSFGPYSNTLEVRIEKPPPVVCLTKRRVSPLMMLHSYPRFVFKVGLPAPLSRMPVLTLMSLTLTQVRAEVFIMLSPAGSQLAR